MNSKYKNAPEVISRFRIISKDGVEIEQADKVTGIQVQQDQENQSGLVQIDVRDFKNGLNIVVEIELPELVSALALATLNAERGDD